ncbi:unnamed protein product [Knipowitschia caucasica]
MKTCLIFICFLTATFRVKGTPHVKHHGAHKSSHSDNTKAGPTEKLLQAAVTSHEDIRPEKDEGVTEVMDSVSEDRAVLMSEEDLETLVKTHDREEDESTENKPEMKAADQVKEIIDKTGPKHEKMLELVESSADSEIPVDLDYASDSTSFHPINIVQVKEMDEKPLPDVDEVNSQAVQKNEAKSKEKEHDKFNIDKHEIKDEEHDAAEIQNDMPVGEVEEGKNDSNVQGSKKQRKQKKKQRSKKQSPQKDEPQVGVEATTQEPVKSEGNSTDTAAHKTKRRRAGKWGPLIGVNPVQIRATVDLYPGSRAALAGVTHDLETSDPCDNFRCKRGKTCKLSDDNKPGCVCQVASECPPSLSELDRVCGTDNQTYDTSCQLFAMKCNLEGTKKGHRLHLDYTGPCKLIPPCLDPELTQFPLRMRDWLKNVLLQLYDHDTTSPGFLTPKQRFRVKKIFESERRLRAGDHPVELLEQDFDKNYHMYIYPVHWQFAQLDQHPSDRQLSHSELAPLRVPLVPMEHCTSLFFQECDSDKDKQVSFKEWTSCFGIKEEDMDTSLLF